MPSSRLFGIIDRVKNINQRKNSAARSRCCLNYEAEKTVRNAMLAAESRKAQSIKSTRQYGMHM